MEEGTVEAGEGGMGKVTVEARKDRREGDTVEAGEEDTCTVDRRGEVESF